MRLAGVRFLARRCLACRRREPGLRLLDRAQPGRHRPTDQPRRARMDAVLRRVLPLRAVSTPVARQCLRDALDPQQVQTATHHHIIGRKIGPAERVLVEVRKGATPPQRVLDAPPDVRLDVSRHVLNRQGAEAFRLPAAGIRQRGDGPHRGLVEAETSSDDSRV